MVSLGEQHADFFESDSDEAGCGGNSSSDGTGKKAVRLEDFVGEWHDSLGHEVRVTLARHRSSVGELDVQLQKPSCSRKPIRLNVKALGEGKFQCGHFELKLDESSAEKIVWGDTRIKGKVSVWERGACRHPARSRSRTRTPPAQRGRNCGCISLGRVDLRCVLHPPLLPPRSVLHSISTPGAWAPPADTAPVTAPEVEEKHSEAPKVSEKNSEVDKLLDDYDASLTHAAAETESAEAEASADALHEAKAKLLAKHLQNPDNSKAEPKLLVQDLFWNPQGKKRGSPGDLPRDPRTPQKVRPGDPRMRTVVVAPAGGA